MQTVDGSTANLAGVSPSASSDLDIIGTLCRILTRSQVIISADLTTPHSCRSYLISYSVIEDEDDFSINTIIRERQEQLNAALQEISDLERVMDGIKNLHRQLIEKKDGITQSMNLHRRLVSGIWRLPTEVLSHIFVHCFPETSHISPPSKTLAPMLLTRICRRWREIAVGMPSLWRRLRLYSNEVGNRRWESIAFCYDLWLKRSRGHPLSLEVWCCSDDSNTILRGLIQPYINQISTLSIRFFPPTDKPELMLENLSALQELTICAYDSFLMPNIAQSISQLPFTMRSLKITFPVLKLHDFSAFTPLMARLTNIEVALDQMNTVPNILHLCPNLSSLTILTGVKQKMRASRPIIHTNLRSLRIAHDIWNTEHLSHLFDVLTLPNLRMFEVRYIEPSQIHALFDVLDSLPHPKSSGIDVQSWPHGDLRALIVRSNCPLKGLVFSGGVTPTDEQRAEYVALIPSLEVVVSRVAR
ncbi:hypothetical protein DFJ58DRAFT_743765 [Suillus subalutaceus]|uniref:uncharacterized protein n=1 Tax=Suillus subalutaceus TaxID=48586 RepID=UPI001B878379|nr:uncharacterized protein DFJ58DRAFT_743765 [Suillus subalutaceus]KAG1863575.1 hypothetical protein DFJ58DRAFT_743765 [Suillus subalutaceus]